VKAVLNVFANKRKRMDSLRRVREREAKRPAMGKRLRAVMDGRTYEELFTEVASEDPLNFPGYREKLSEVSRRTGQKDAMIAAAGEIGGYPVIACELSREFFMGSMGTAVGEKVALAAEEAERRKVPLIIFSASGGARMQEGMFSLLQMAKTSAAVEHMKQSGGLYISILTHPTTGGVSASFASIGDIILAEPGALIGFAGPRVIEQTIHEKLPAGFQRAEFQLEHGFVDRIVAPEDMRRTLIQILRIHERKAEG
jgi:acetyl-CoA carboxylase carboxyl transferase beta subunit